MRTFVTADPRAGDTRPRRWSHSPARVFGALARAVPDHAMPHVLLGESRPHKALAAGEHPGMAALAAAALKHDAGQYIKLLRHLPDVVRRVMREHKLAAFARIKSPKGGRTAAKRARPSRRAVAAGGCWSSNSG